MKRLVPVVLAFVFVVVAALRLVAGEAAPPPGDLSFSAHNSVYNAEGRFTSWSITKADIPNGDLTKGVVMIEVDLASVNEASPKLAAHLRTPDFFDVAKFQKATIEIANAKSTGEKRYEATATIDLHGVKGTCPVEFEVVKDKPLTIQGTAKLDRVAFGIGEPYDAGNKYAPKNEVKVALTAKLSD
jgi:polyisoprenoid-binding protein YceI